MSEASFVNFLLKEIRGKRFAFKVSEKYQGGIPDIYVVGGYWIEAKVSSMPVRAVNVMRLVSELQRDRLDALVDGGDRAYVAIRWVDSGRGVVTLTPWETFKTIVAWTEEMVRRAEVQSFSNYFCAG